MLLLSKKKKEKKERKQQPKVHSMNYKTGGKEGKNIFQYASVEVAVIFIMLYSHTVGKLSFGSTSSVMNQVSTNENKQKK